MLIFAVLMIFYPNVVILWCHVYHNYSSIFPTKAYNLNELFVNNCYYKLGFPQRAFKMLTMFCLVFNIRALLFLKRCNLFIGADSNPIAVLLEGVNWIYNSRLIIRLVCQEVGSFKQSAIRCFNSNNQQQAYFNLSETKFFLPIIEFCC